MSDMVSLIKQADRKRTRVFQRLPRYKRRRAMSWNIHLLPKHLRKFAEAESGPARIKHRKRRKLKRRKNLTSKNRLVTHLFHVKRMKMEEKWGVIIPVRHHEKIFKTTYRFQSQRCTMFDASWYSCYEFTAKNKSMILNLLKPYIKGSIDGVMYSGGKREGSVHIYNKDCVGPVKFLWKTSTDQEDSQLWLWVHPAMIPQLSELKNDNIKIRVRQDLARYELRGPRATAALSSVLMINKTSPPMSLQVFQAISGEGTRPDSLPRSMVMCLTIDEPTKEMKRMKQGTSVTSQPMMEVPNGLTATDLWTNDKSLDVMLIQQSFPVFGSGWDIICNSHHGVHIWSKLALLNGMVPIPLFDRNRMFTENLLEVFPDDYPDSKSLGNESIVPISRFPGDPGMIRVILQFKLGGKTTNGGFIYKLNKKTSRAVKYDTKSEKIGFVTTTTYSMENGIMIAIGFVDANKFSFEKINKKEANCLVHSEKDLYMYPCFLEKRL